MNNKFKFLKEELDQEIYTIKKVASILGYTYVGAKTFLDNAGILKKHPKIGNYVLIKDFNDHLEKVRQEIIGD